MKRSTWIGGTVFLVLLLGAAAWFLAISPAFVAAAEVREETVQTEERNEILHLQVATLAADFAKLDQHKAELASMRVQVPTSAELADMLRQVDQVATTHGVTVTSLSPGVPVTVVPPASAAAPPPPADETEGSTDEEAEQSADADETAPAPEAVAPVAVAVPAGMVAIPLSITVLGTYDATIAFVDDLQNALPRLVLVTDFTGTAQKEATESAGKPATAPGDQELVVSAFTYVLPDPWAAAPDAEPAPAALPATVPGKNPLVPVLGQ
ncbi:type 4a pilus biogenesis protein PilO [Cellulomonas xiejunii]|uniref:Type 4a pilus biogenesis protein PilO n=1 Tax=Cellulomonas xiejunii TaxID=2968083 RepID=A0ABY5KV66_9CELL|nr:type 4a pilus biogenesis protein PilO [Cellulomonas xiejunii]MCC2314821.1 type 4a pilus biogenesis protein PilO [Cellulomonas xiejunii]MCC2323103.1 type 4a pilus biogenesis protein PilO [Cellulomonas xiejunii]UUI73593.1 type 4a pilus biogenesis protein PilO [Cellulomonas xiejunii]